MNRKVFVILTVLTILFTLLLAIGCSKLTDDSPSGDIVSSGNDNSGENIDSGNGNVGNSGENVDSGDDIKEHVHTFEKEWSNDSLYHWFASTCEHDLIKDKAKHSFDDNGMCSACKYYNTYGLLYKLN